jgi:hypothetical protein
MIIKHRDSREEDIRKLANLLTYRLSPKQRFLIERELQAIKSGTSGEDDAAYYINFYYGDSKRWAVIHDLRIEFNGRVAQIDHILINRIFDIYILESKNFKYGVRITESGEFEVYYRRQYIGIPSPVEQNKRHIELLSRFIEHKGILPRRLGVPIKPRFLNYVLISPRAVIKRPNPKKFDSSNVIKADTLKTIIDENIDKIDTMNSLMALSKFSSFSVVEEFARRLVSFHCTAKIDWEKRFDITTKIKDPMQKRTPTYFCASCKTTISEREARFCWNNPARFGGRAFCRQCQRKIAVT